MARPRKPDSERLTEYVGIPVTPVDKLQLDTAARRANSKPIPLARRILRAGIAELGRERKPAKVATAK